MKKYLITLLFFMMSSSGFALYMGSAVEPEAVTIGPVLSEDSLFGMKLGFEEDFMFDNKLKTYGNQNERLNRFSYILNQGVATLGIFNRAEVYASLGSMGASLSYQEPILARKVECGTKNQLTWGVGSRVLLWKWGNIGLGMQGSYQWAEMYLNEGTIDGVAFYLKQPKSSNPPRRANEAKLIYNQWQVGFGASYQVDFFIPYIAVKGTNTKAHLFNLDPLIDLPSLSVKMRNRTWIGLVLGVTLAASKAFDFTAEADLFDAQALSLVGNIRF